MAQWQTSNSAYGSFYKLPPREKVKDPQHALLVALAPAEPEPESEAAAALPEPDTSSAVPGAAVLLGARAVVQPGDGSCLFHSLAHGTSSDAGRLRHAVADLVESSPDTPIGGEPLREWIKWDSGLTPARYAGRMRGTGSWGGAIEIAVFARLFGIAVYVYEQVDGDPGRHRRVAAFLPPHETEQSAHLVYRGGVHYDALVL
tara:strand:+ start:4 stop:609 length:606 start_codon:yes stop_codon:yes gene_type:complete